MLSSVRSIMGVGPSKGFRIGPTGRLSPVSLAPHVSRADVRLMRVVSGVRLGALPPSVLARVSPTRP